jgi:hypothetical protein
LNNENLSKIETKNDSKYFGKESKSIGILSIKLKRRESKEIDYSVNEKLKKSINNL